MSVVVYSTTLCPYCFLAKRLLSRRGIEYRELRLGRDPGGRAELSRLSGGGRTYPQIMLGARRVDGFVELRRLDRQGELGRLAQDGGGAV
jgi:glutaredoxin 3